MAQVYRGKVKTEKKSKLGALIDELYLHDRGIRKQENVLRDLKKARKVVEDKLLDQFDKEDISGAQGRRGKAGLRKGRHPKVKDRAKLLKYILKTKAFDLFTNALAKKAYFDRLENGEQVPGTEIFTSYKVTVSKLKRR